MGQEREEDQQSHGSTISKNGLGSASINLLGQLRIGQCGKPACQIPPTNCPKLLDIDRY